VNRQIFQRTHQKNPSKGRKEFLCVIIRYPPLVYPVRGTKILSCGCGLKLFSLLRGTNSKTTHYLLSYYVGYTARHLHQRIAEHKCSAIGKHILEEHSDKNLLNEGQFRVLKKWHEKFDRLVYEMLFIKELRPSLNIEGDSISAKLLV